MNSLIRQAIDQLCNFFIQLYLQDSKTKLRRTFLACGSGLRKELAPRFTYFLRNFKMILMILLNK